MNKAFFTSAELPHTAAARAATFGSAVSARQLYSLGIGKSPTEERDDNGS